MATAELVEMVQNREDEDFFIGLQSKLTHFTTEQMGNTLSRLRHAELRTWPVDLLESYLEDLNRAIEYRDSLTVMRASYMYGSSIGGFAGGSEFYMQKEKVEQVNFIMKVSLIWETQSRTVLPRLTRNMPAILSEEDSDNGDFISYETRLHSELLTYSYKTLSIYAAHVADCWINKQNANFEVYNQAARDLGYSCAAEAEQNEVTL